MSFLVWCAMRDLNPHGRPLEPKSSASANSANRAYLVTPPRIELGLPPWKGGVLTAWPWSHINRQRPTFPGSFPPSIIGAKELNFCVRDGNRCVLPAIVTGFIRILISTFKPELLYPTYSLSNAKAFDHHITSNAKAFDKDNHLIKCSTF